MFRRFGPNYMVTLYLLDMTSSLAALWIAQRLRLAPVGPPITAEDATVPGLMYFLVTAVFGFVFPMMRLYDARRIYRALEEAKQVGVGVAVAGVLLTGALFLVHWIVPRLVFLYLIAVAALLMFGCRATLRALYRRGHLGAAEPVVLIAGAGSRGRQAAKMLASTGVRVTGFVDDDPAKHGRRVDGCMVLGDLDEISSVVQREAVTDVVFALPSGAYERLRRLLVTLWKIPLHVCTVSDFGDLGFARISTESLGALTVIALREPVVDGFQRIVKRLIDLILGLVITLCVLPIGSVIAVLIRLDSPGPIVFRQQRVGENGRVFTMYKFRTMVADAEQRQHAVTTYTSSGQIVHKRPDDPRVTRVGRILRRLSLDELPQLANVLRGEMSLVGPRPEMPWIVETYTPWQYQRLTVPQGMTSWYVVNGRSETPMHLNTEEDLRYVHDYSVLQDLKILWKSMAAVVKGRGAF
jgi:exopolysaccharide biosynthesis polyprenyl glycosylphosphotransferase